MIIACIGEVFSSIHVHPHPTPTPTPPHPTHQMSSSMEQVQTRGILDVMKDSLEDRPQQHGRDMTEAEVRYKLIIDPSEDDSLVRLLFSFGVLQREKTRMFVCSDFPGDSQLQKVCKALA